MRLPSFCGPQGTGTRAVSLRRPSSKCRGGSRGWPDGRSGRKARLHESPREGPECTRKQPFHRHAKYALRVKTLARFHTHLFRSLFRALRPTKKLWKSSLRAAGRKISRSFDTASVQSRSSDAPADRPHSEQGPEHRAAIVAWNHAEALHSPLRHAAIVPLPVGRHPGRQLLVSRKVAAAIGRAAAKPVIRWALQSTFY